MSSIRTTSAPSSSQYYVDLTYPLLADPRENRHQPGCTSTMSDCPTRAWRLGKQPIRLDNERFFSDVDFRQTPMLFNGLTVVKPDPARYGGGCRHC